MANTKQSYIRPACVRVPSQAEIILLCNRTYRAIWLLQLMSKYKPNQRQNRNLLYPIKMLIKKVPFKWLLAFDFVPFRAPNKNDKNWSKLSQWKTCHTFLQLRVIVKITSASKINLVSIFIAGIKCQRTAIANSFDFLAPSVQQQKKNFMGLKTFLSSSEVRC